MTKVIFVSADGQKSIEIDAPPGKRLLELAQVHEQPLEGVCEGSMACSTCHVIVAAEDFQNLPPPSEEEEDMLDFAYGVNRYSRLACQLWTVEGLERLEVRMPGGSVNMQNG